MSTASERARAKAERLSALSRPTSGGGVEPVVQETRAERVKPVRLSLDLAPALFEDFEDWTIRASRSVGTKLNKADVYRVLTRRLLEDEVLAAEVVAVLRADARR